jgi:GC-rich sequence DNA-binding factor
MAKITVSHASNTAALNNIILERESVDQRETEMREMVEKAEEKRAWFDGFREWVEGVAGFLDEKASWKTFYQFLNLTCYSVSNA